MNVFGLVEVHRRSVAQAQRVQLDDLRAELALATDRLATCAEALDAAECDLAQQRESAQRRSAQPADPTAPTRAGEEPPAVVGELVTLADRLVDLTGAAAPADTAQAAEVLGWLGRRVDALLVACEVTCITDDGPVDGLRHEVVAARPAPRAELVDHIADTVRPGYRWRADLLRAQQVVAYTADHS